MVWSVLRAELDRRAAELGGPPSVLDVGGGSGGFAVPLAEAGHAVTVVDTSPDALATLHRRAAEAGVAHRVTGVSADVDGLADAVPAGGYELVLCHGLLEVVDDPAGTLAAVAAAASAGGCVSVLVAGRPAAVLARALGGHPADALRLLADESGRWGDGDGVLRRFDTAGVSALVASAGLVVESVHGVRVVADLLPGAVLDVPGAVEALRELELAASAVPPYRDVATQLHVLGRVPADPG